MTGLGNVRSMSRVASIFAAISIVAAATGGVFLVHIPTTATESGASPSPAEPPAGYAAVHDAGVTGTNVTIGVVEATGFDIDDPAYADSVVAARAFGTGKTLTNDGRNEHGTAVAATLAAVAPGSDLYLTTFADESDYRSALAWLADRDIDIVVVPTSFYGKPGDGTGRNAQATADLARDTVVVTASGNLGRSYWAGRYRPENGSMLVRDQATGEPVTLEVSGDQTRLWLSWAALDERYRLRIEQNGTTIASSNSYPDDDVPNERLSRQLPSGTYSLRVDGPTAVTGTRLRLEALSGALNGGHKNGSIVAPATARGVVVVSAFDQSTGTVAPYSSNGPTADGRPGVDVVGPAAPPVATGQNVTGTSYAAAYVAGVSALVLSAHPDASPTMVERTLERTAYDLGRPSWGTASGHGLVTPRRAVAAARGDPSGSNGD
jgi:hypothetical protein